MAFSYRELLEQFLTARRTSASDTGAFIAMKHDRDLVPGMQERLTRISEAYGFFTALSYETQGITDNGADVSVRFRELHAAADSAHAVIGFQIKSHEELKDAAAVAKLKAQRDDAFRKIPGLAHYYIVLCAAEGALKKRLNAIRSEFLGASQTTVVDPAQALRFYRRTLLQIDSQVKVLMDESDKVLLLLRRELDTGSATTKALVCSLVARFVLTGDLDVPVANLMEGALKHQYDIAVLEAERTQAHVAAMEESYNLGDEVDEGEDLPSGLTHLLDGGLENGSALAADLSNVEGDFIEQSPDGQTVRLLLNRLPAAIAVAADAVVRFDYTANEVVEYLLDLAGEGS